MDPTAIIVAILGSGLLSTIINQVCNYLNRRADARNGIQQGLRLVLKDRLRFLCIRYIEQGWIYEDELEDLIAMHDCYHKTLQGNGYLDELMARAKKLEIKGVGKK